MRTFEEWLKDENLDEGLMKNLALGAALAGGAMGITGCGDSSCKAPQSVDYDSVRGDSLGKPFGVYTSDSFLTWQCEGNAKGCG